MKKILCLVMFLATATAFSEQAADNAPPAKAALCVACHGENGISSNPLWPNLAGQHAAYLQKQLMDFKAGKTRNAATMTGIIDSLSNEEIKELAEYYASLPIPDDNKTPKKYLKRGELLYRGGDFSEQITACIACHGPRGTGNAQAGFPLLSGQHAQYTLSQLEAFKTHERSNDLNHIMRDISARLDKQDMEALAYYLQGLY